MELAFAPTAAVALVAGLAVELRLFASGRAPGRREAIVWSAGWLLLALRTRSRPSLRHALRLVMIAVVAADIAFAVDSIPAAFAVTRDPLVIWTANAFALLGLGSLLALVEILVRRFRYIDATEWTHSRTPISSSDCRSSAGSR